MSESGGTGTRPGFVVGGIILAVVLGALLVWMRSGPKALPVDEHLNRLKGGTTVERATAAEALGNLGASGAVDPLIAASKDKEWTVRRAAATSLGQLRDGRALPALIELLKDASPWVRIAAARALVTIGDSSAVKPLESMVKKEKAKGKQKNPDVISSGEAAIQALQSK